MELLVVAVLQNSDTVSHAVFSKKVEFETLPRVGDTLLMEEVSSQWFEVEMVFHKKERDSRFVPCSIRIRYSIHDGAPPFQWKTEKKEFIRNGWTFND